MMNFGKKVRVGNFELLKLVKTLGKKDVAAIRREMGLEGVKNLERARMPFIKVSSVSGNWAVEYAMGCSYYSFIEQCFDDNGEIIEKHWQTLLNMCTMLYADTMVMGDAEYFTDKGNALNGFLGRQKKDISDEDDAKELESVREYEEAASRIEDMAEHIEKEEKKATRRRNGRKKGA